MLNALLKLPRWLAGALLLLAVPVAPASATVIIDNNPGGIIEDFVSSYRELAKQGDKVIIRGDCVSACSLITALVPAGRVCATPTARLGFHSASQFTEAGIVYSKEATEAIWQMYPAKVRKIVTANGWDGGEHPKVVFIPATEFYKPCASGHFMDDTAGVPTSFQAPWFGPEVNPEAVPLPTPKHTAAPKRPTPHKAPQVKPAVPVVHTPAAKPKAPEVAPVSPQAPVGRGWLWSLLQNIASIVIVGVAVAVVVRFVRSYRKVAA